MLNKEPIRTLCCSCTTVCSLFFLVGLIIYLSSIPPSIQLKCTVLSNNDTSITYCYNEICNTKDMYNDWQYDINTLQCYLNNNYPVNSTVDCYFYKKEKLQYGISVDLNISMGIMFMYTSLGIFIIFTLIIYLINFLIYIYNRNNFTNISKIDRLKFLILLSDLKEEEKINI